MKICIINLERSARRRDAIGRRLNELGIAHTFVRALDATAGEHLAFPNCIGNRPSRTGRPLTPDEYACFASHYLTWKLCVASGQPVVIMEGDILFDRKQRSRSHLGETAPSSCRGCSPKGPGGGKPVNLWLDGHYYGGERSDRRRGHR